MGVKLICFDMDGVIFKDINFWMELHRVYGTLEEGKVLTKKYLKTDYDRLVEEVVVKLWKGNDAKPYYDLINSIEYLPGVKETFDKVKSAGLITAIVSASSIDVARRVDKDYGVDHVYANELVIKDGKVSGEFIWPIGVGNDAKARVVWELSDQLGISTDDIIFIGDSDTDLEAFEECGISIAFNSESEKLKSAATHVVDSDNLADIIPVLEKYL